MIVSKPKTTVNKLGAQVQASLSPQKILVIGQKIASGSSVAGVVEKGVGESDIADKFGTKSMLGAQLRSVFKIFKDSGSLALPQVDVLPLEDVLAGVKAFNSITITEIGGSTGLATKAGRIKIILGSKKKHTYTVDISVGQAILTGAGSISEVIAGLINDDPYSLLTSVNVSGVITNTFVNKGTVGNATNIKIEGLSYDGTQYVLGNVKFVITAFASGATDPTVTSILNAVGKTRYQTIVAPKQYGTTYLTDFLDARWNVDNAILDGVSIVKMTATYADTLSALGSLNSKSLVAVCDELVDSAMHKGSAIVEYDFSVSAILGAIRALRLTDGANISRITPASDSASADAVGGVPIATLPYFNTPLFDIAVLDDDIGFDDQTEVPNIISAGGTIIGNDISGNTVLLGDVVTTYKTDVSGNPDPSFKFLNYVDALSAGVEYQFVNIKKDFKQHRLTQGNVKNRRAMVNITTFNATLVRYFTHLQALLIAPDSPDVTKAYKANISSVADYINGKITSDNQLSIVTQLREVLVNTKMSFEI